MIETVRTKVFKLMNGDDSGHGSDHVERVWLLARKLAEHKNVDLEVVELAALLHDVDDYKLVGDEVADKLLNARKIMAESGVSADKADKVCSIISHMGYSKLLAGIRPVTEEGKIVSDADMLDAIGANGIIRCLSFALARCQKYGTPIFEKNTWPELRLSFEEYRKSGRRSDNFINHFFEKLLRLHNLMLTEDGQKEAENRQRIMVLFLQSFFRENGLGDWTAFLEKYLKDNNFASSLNYEAF